MFSKSAVPVFLVTILLKQVGQSVTYSLFFHSQVDLSEAFLSICKEAVVSHRGKPDALVQIWESTQDCLS